MRSNFLGRIGAVILASTLALPFSAALAQRGGHGGGWHGGGWGWRWGPSFGFVVPPYGYGWPYYYPPPVYYAPAPYYPYGYPYGYTYPYRYSSLPATTVPLPALTVRHILRLIRTTAAHPTNQSPALADPLWRNLRRCCSAQTAEETCRTPNGS
jgi:hypothetical protein